MEIVTKVQLTRSKKSFLVHSSISTLLIYSIYHGNTYVFVFFLLAFFLCDILASFSITPDYLEKNGQKILFKDIVDIRKIFLWIVIIDRSGDSFSLNSGWFSEADRRKLEKALEVSFL